MIGRHAPIGILLIKPVYRRLSDADRAELDRRLMGALARALTRFAESAISATEATRRLVRAFREAGL